MKKHIKLISLLFFIISSMTVGAVTLPSSSFVPSGGSGDGGYDPISIDPIQSVPSYSYTALGASSCPTEYPESQICYECCSDEMSTCLYNGGTFEACQAAMIECYLACDRTYSLPIGDAIPFMLLLIVLYGIIRYRKNMAFRVINNQKGE